MSESDRIERLRLAAALAAYPRPTNEPPKRFGGRGDYKPKAKRRG